MKINRIFLAGLLRAQDISLVCKLLFFLVLDKFVNTVLRRKTLANTKYDIKIFNNHYSMYVRMKRIDGSSNRENTI